MGCARTVREAWLLGLQFKAEGQETLTVRLPPAGQPRHMHACGCVLACADKRLIILITYTHPDPVLVFIFKFILVPVFRDRGNMGYIPGRLLYVFVHCALHAIIVIKQVNELRNVIYPEYHL